MVTFMLIFGLTTVATAKETISTDDANAIQLLVQSVEKASPVVWKAALRQQYIRHYCNMGVTFLLVILAGIYLVTAPKCYHLLVTPPVKPKDRGDEYHQEVLYVYQQNKRLACHTVPLILCAVLVLFLLCSVGSYLIFTLNPDYPAITDLARMLR